MDALMGLCRPVTVYRRQGQQVLRWVCRGYYQWQDHRQADTFQRKFLFIGPGTQPLCPGDRIFDGIGPEQVCWETFLPVSVEGLSEAAYASCYRWGDHTHWEAGR